MVPGVSLVKKPTAFLTNALRIADPLAQKYCGGHRYITLIGVRAHRAEVCPQQLCREILLGLIDQMRQDGRIMLGGLGSVAKYEDNPAESAHWLARYWDDITGKELDPGMVSEPRKEEMKEFKKHTAYTKVPLPQRWDRTGPDVSRLE